MLEGRAHCGAAFFYGIVLQLLNMKIHSKKIKFVLTTILCSFALLFSACAETDSSSSVPTDSERQTIIEQTNINLNGDLKITDVGSYTGVYMEDGTDEIVTGVLMIIVTNEGDADLQYGKITLDAGEDDAVFELSTLPRGESVVLLENNRMSYDSNFTYKDAVLENAAFFTSELSLMEDSLQIQTLNGVMNVTNISDSDIDGDIYIYYKNAAMDLYYGGITYRSSIAGGLKQGETRQLSGGHISKTGTKVMFVNIV